MGDGEEKFWQNHRKLLFLNRFSKMPIRSKKQPNYTRDKPADASVFSLTFLNFHSIFTFPHYREATLNDEMK